MKDRISDFIAEGGKIIEKYQNFIFENFSVKRLFDVNNTKFNALIENNIKKKEIDLLINNIKFLKKDKHTSLKPDTKFEKVLKQDMDDLIKNNPDNLEELKFLAKKLNIEIEKTEK